MSAATDDTVTCDGSRKTTNALLDRLHVVLGKLTGHPPPPQDPDDMALVSEDDEEE